MSGKSPFDREEYRRVLKNVLLTATDEQIELLLDSKERSERNLRTGDNVVHFFYHGKLIPENEIEELRTELETAGLQLSYQDKHTIIKNSVQTTFEAIITFVIAHELRSALATSAVYDALKFFILKAWAATGKSDFRSGTKKLPTVMQIAIPLPHNRTIIYLIRRHNIPEKEVKKALDKILNTAEQHGSQLPPSEKRVIKYYYLSKKGNWKTKDTNEEVIAKMNKVIS